MGTLLLLGRVSNLPTVWSNCLAGWWLGGGGHWSKLAALSLAVTFLYFGGMFLNDAFDADFDRQYRTTRPIPSGLISEEAVWRWGYLWLALGTGGLMLLGQPTAMFALLLTASILVYDALHKFAAAAPILMGSCRLLVYLVAATTGQDGVTGYVLWAGLALATYVAGLSCLARKESWQAPVASWPALLLGAPVYLAILANDGWLRVTGCCLALILVLWVFWAMSNLLRGSDHNVVYTVSRLLAGIVLVDLLAVAEPGRPGTLLFPLCFVLALILQRFVPAT